MEGDAVAQLLATGDCQRTPTCRLDLALKWSISPIPINPYSASWTMLSKKTACHHNSPLNIINAVISWADISLNSSHQIPGLKLTEKIQHDNFKNLVTDNAQKNVSFYEYVSMNFNKMTFNMTDSSWKKRKSLLTHKLLQMKVLLLRFTLQRLVLIHTDQ